VAPSRRPAQGLPRHASLSRAACALSLSPRGVRCVHGALEGLDQHEVVASRGGGLGLARPAHRLVEAPCRVITVRGFMAKKVLFLEFNEITRTIIDPMIQKGKLPAMARLFAEGTVAAPESVDQPPHLDPWVTWITVHTGVDRSVHGATVLEQDS